MIEIGVTITGADDEVNPQILDEIGRDFPFVEWGILFSKSREGQPRYPTAAWREKMYWATNDRGEYYNLAAHLCGKSVDAFLASYGHLENEVTMGYNAIQFNRLTAENKDQIFQVAADGNSTVIVQYSKNTDILLNGLFDEDVPEDLLILLDASGGKGISWQEEGWPDIPEPWATRLAVGYAGGINEDNIEQTVFELVQSHKDIKNGGIWIDLESGARTEDKFDIDKVLRILEKVKAGGEDQ
jgi:phosphoribosylanthranilate isomerase